MHAVHLTYTTKYKALDLKIQKIGTVLKTDIRKKQLERVFSGKVCARIRRQDRPSSKVRKRPKRGGRKESHWVDKKYGSQPYCCPRFAPCARPISFQGKWGFLIWKRKKKKKRENRSHEKRGRHMFILEKEKFCTFRRLMRKTNRTTKKKAAAIKKHKKEKR